MKHLYVKLFGGRYINDKTDCHYHYAGYFPLMIARYKFSKEQRKKLNRYNKAIILLNEIENEKNP